MSYEKEIYIIAQAFSQIEQRLFEVIATRRVLVTIFDSDGIFPSNAWTLSDAHSLLDHRVIAMLAIDGCVNGMYSLVADRQSKSLNYPKHISELKAFRNLVEVFYMPLVEKFCRKHQSEIDRIAIQRNHRSAHSSRAIYIAGFINRDPNGDPVETDSKFWPIDASEILSKMKIFQEKQIRFLADLLSRTRTLIASEAICSDQSMAAEQADFLSAHPLH